MSTPTRALRQGHAAFRLTFLALFATTMCSCQTFTTQPRGTQDAQLNRVSRGKSQGTQVQISDQALPKRTSTPEQPVVPTRFSLRHESKATPCPTCRPGPASLPPSAYGDLDACASDLAPIEEYVCNGGDQNVSVQVKRDWSVQGLHSGDTVVHYDTIDGKTVVVPSNDVCIYAPRFASVRKVYGIVAHQQFDSLAGVEAPVGPELSSDLGQATTVVQPLQAGRKHSVKGMQSFREKTRGIGVENAQRPAITEEQFLPFEDLAIIRKGFFDNSEKARLAERLQAAITWTSEQGLQILLDNETAVEAIGTNSTQSIYVYELPPGKSRLRIVKIASKQNAKPGELIEFTLRFDNVGDQTIGNVTVIDKLHDRLEYVADSARCTLPAEFFTEDEDGFPRVLRWEITEPLKVGEGGLIRFTCKVR